MYYLSAEFLMGRSLLNTVANLNIEGEYGAALKQLGYDMETVVDQVGRRRGDADTGGGAHYGGRSAGARGRGA